jgi:hypothetical protein
MLSLLLLKIVEIRLMESPEAYRQVMPTSNSVKTPGVLKVFYEANRIADLSIRYLRVA